MVDRFIDLIGPCSFLLLLISGSFDSNFFILFFFSLREGVSESSFSAPQVLSRESSNAPCAAGHLSIPFLFFFFLILPLLHLGFRFQV